MQIAAKRKRNALEKRENKIAFLFILLPVIGFCVFTIGSMIFTFVFSFTSFNKLTGEITALKNGIFGNYEKLFTSVSHSKFFIGSIENTLILLLSIPFSMILGLVTAGLLKLGEVKGAKIYQILYYVPTVSSAVALNIVWRYIFNDEFGVINNVFNLDIHWLGGGTGNGKYLRSAIIIKNSINGIGSAMIMYLAGMLNVPKDYYEAADIDGASKLRQFFSITLPLITPMTFYLLITGLIGGLQSYADSQVFANGNANAQTIVHFIWSRGIGGTAKDGYGIAASASILLATAIMIITVIQFKFSNKWVYEE